MLRAKRAAFAAMALCIVISIATTVLAATYKYDDNEQLTTIVFDSGNRIVYTYAETGNIAVVNFYQAGTETAPKITTPPGSLLAGERGIPYNFTVTTDTISDSFKVTKGSLPDGLRLLDSGVITGTPTIVGTSHFSVTAANSAGLSAEVAFFIRVEHNKGNNNNGDNQTNGTTDSNNNQNQSSYTRTNTITTQPTDVSEYILRKLQNEKQPVIVLDNESKIILSGSVLLEFLKENKNLTITRGLASLLITPENISELKIKKDDQIVIGFSLFKAPVIGNQFPLENKHFLEHFYDITITLNGKNIGVLNTPLTIRYDLSEITLTGKQRGQITGVRYLEKNKYNQLGGIFVSEHVFEFETSFLSVYGVILDDRPTTSIRSIAKTLSAPVE